MASCMERPCCRNGVGLCEFWRMLVRSWMVIASQSMEDICGMLQRGLQNATVLEIQVPPVVGVKH